MPVYTARHAIITGLILACAQLAMAQDDGQTRTPYYGAGGSTLFSMVAMPGVQKELGLDDAVSKTLMDALREIDPKHPAFRTPEDRQKINKIANETERKTEEAMQKALTKEQLQRLEQMEMQHLGGRALLIAKYAEKWDLTDEQQERLATIRSSFNSDASLQNGEDSPTRLKRYKNDLLAVLTSEQLKQWNEMLGTPFKVPPFSGPAWRLLLVPEVQKEIGLSDDVARGLEESVAAIQKEGSAEVFRAISTGPGNRDLAESRRRSQQTIDVVRSSLTALQWNRLQELILQQTGPLSLANHEVAETLGLTQEQRDQVREAIAVRRPNIAEGRPPSISANEARARRLKEQTDLLDILTQDQKQHWEAMQGKKVDMLVLRRPAAVPAEK